MGLKDQLPGGRVQIVALWVLAVVFVVLAIANVPVLGIDPVSLAVLATVFAALTTTYNWNAQAA
ncbi:hypothetical protein [Halorubellus litoreus]|uniref:Uncharacterized protein n=1 Tax=Halorubellus litoreus TaxID=755308 RepID=A0ABD5V9B8_9EURY